MQEKKPWQPFHSLQQLLAQLELSRPYGGIFGQPMKPLNYASRRILGEYAVINSNDEIMPNSEWLRQQIILYARLIIDQLLAIERFIPQNEYENIILLRKLVSTIYSLVLLLEVKSTDTLESNDHLQHRQDHRTLNPQTSLNKQLENAKLLLTYINFLPDLTDEQLQFRTLMEKSIHDLEKALSHPSSQIQFTQNPVIIQTNDSAIYDLIIKGIIEFCTQNGQSITENSIFFYIIVYNLAICPSYFRLVSLKRPFHRARISNQLIDKIFDQAQNLRATTHHRSLT